MNLEDFIQCKDFEVIKEPYPHIVVDNFFKEDFYKKLCALFNQKVTLGLAETKDDDRFSRFSRYDAYSWNLDPYKKSPASLFNSKEWENFIADIFQIELSHDVTTCFHYHKIGSADGWAHNDFNVCSFKEDRLPNGMNPWHHQCIYTDDSPDKQAGTLKRMRAVALLYYFNNEEWQEGDGGETGIYSSRDKGNLVKKVAPINNRLLAFEVSPASFHGFLCNKKSERITLNQWLHQEPNIALKKHDVNTWESWG